MISKDRAKQIGWPDTDIDMRAWSLAKIALPQGTSSELLKKAQEIKEALKKETK